MKEPAAFYQVAIIGPAAKGQRGRLQKALTHTVRVLGLPPTKVLRFLSERSFRRRNPKYPLVAVYFGGPKPTPSQRRIAGELMGEDAAVLPVVPTTEGFSSQVPECLKDVNGFPLDPDDPELVRVAQWVAAALGLTRERRYSFISYKRDEGSRLALQLHQALDARGWRSFLDTHSVLPGVDFQGSLWDRMNDSDLLVLLDSPGTLKSEWVRKEIARADQLGMGVLQVIWPGHTPDRATDLATRIYLKESDFRRGNLTRRGGLLLRTGVMGRLLSDAERLRARSLAARRDRLVRTFTARVRDAGLMVVRREIDLLDVTGQKRSYSVMPVVGHIDSTVAFRAEQRMGSPSSSAGKGPSPVLLYDSLGLLQDRIDHIKWLDKHLPVKSVASQKAATWAAKA